jgi:sugar phosphate isomerase/epimerase
VQFGISTRLYHDRRLGQEQIVEVAEHGFEFLELFATRTHFDYHDPAAADALGGWLAQSGGRLHSVHAPVAAGIGRDGWDRPYSLASADTARRTAAVQEVGALAALARRLPYEYLVVHLGLPDAPGPAPGENTPAAARRSVEELQELTAAAGVRLALEVIPNRLSSVESLVRLIDDLELADGGVCLDFGHAHLMGDVVDAIEGASGHLFTTHVHDNRGRHDEHLVPFEGTIDWAQALFAIQKVGYDGVLLMELARAGSTGDVLRRAQAARRRMEQLFDSE